MPITNKPSNCFWLTATCMTKYPQLFRKLSVKWSVTFIVCNLWGTFFKFSHLNNITKLYWFNLWVVLCQITQNTELFPKAFQGFSWNFYAKVLNILFTKTLKDNILLYHLMIFVKKANFQFSLAVIWHCMFFFHWVQKICRSQLVMAWLVAY